ncbi:hypothetical protein GCM10028810_66430 [Spirosoma litoris]
MLLLSIVGIAISQPTGSHLSETKSPLLTETGAKRKFIGLNQIEVELGQRNTLLIGFDRYTQLLARKNVDSVLRLVIADYHKIEDTTQSPTQATHALVRLGETDRTIAMHYTPQSTASFRFRDGDEPLQMKTLQDTLQIVWVSSVSQAIPDDFSIYLFVNNLHDIERLLKGGGVNQRLQQAIEATRAYKNHDLTNPRISFALIQSADKQTKVQRVGAVASPFLSLQPGVGVGLIRNQWVPSLNFDVQLIPSQLKCIGYQVGYTSNFFFQQGADGGFQTFRNDFLNVGVTFYRANKGSRFTNFSRQIASFYIGIPVYRRGSYFESNTIRFGGTVYQNKLFKVQSDFYMNGFFKNVIPGLRLVVGL